MNVILNTRNAIIVLDIESTMAINITTGVKFDTGKRIDGSTVYGKVIDFGVLPDSTTGEVPHGESIDLSRWNYLKIMAYNSDDGESYSNHNNIDRVYLNSINIAVVTTAVMSAFTAIVYIEFIEP